MYTNISDILFSALYSVCLRVGSVMTSAHSCVRSPTSSTMSPSRACLSLSLFSREISLSSSSLSDSKLRSTRNRSYTHTGHTVNVSISRHGAPHLEVLVTSLHVARLSAEAGESLHAHGHHHAPRVAQRPAPVQGGCVYTQKTVDAHQTCFNMANLEQAGCRSAAAEFRQPIL